MIILISQKLRHKVVKQLAEGHVSSELSDPKFPTTWLCSLLHVLRSLGSHSVRACDPKEPLTIPSAIPPLASLFCRGLCGWEDQPKSNKCPRA